MQPTFRTDLTCSREEQQGVVFYRIDDPETRTSFRLYEIEYLIAQKLNGQRTVSDVIDGVKTDYNFDISEADLQKFISQLESMGFVRGPAGGAPQSMATTSSEAYTQEMKVQPARARRRDQDVSLAVPAQDEAELHRLLKSAFLHIRQGYVVHARDYLLAAREHSPADARLGKIVSHIEVLGDEPARPDLEQLWVQCEELFPELVNEVGPLVESRGGGAAAAAEAAQRTTEAWDDDVKVRVRWSLLLVILVVVGSGVLYYVAHALHIFDGPVKVRLDTLQGMRVPVFFPNPAVAIKPVQETWLTFGAAGKVGEELARVGSRVQEGEILGSLDLPSKMTSALRVGRDSVKRTELEYDKVAKRLAKLLNDREAVETERADAEKHIKELRPKSVLKPDAAAKKALDTWKKALDKANKKLSAFAKKERAPRAAEAKSKKKVEMTKKKVAALEARLSSKLLRAPFGGEVTEVKVSAGEVVQANSQAMHLRNPLLARLVFNVKNATTLQPGGEALISVKEGNPLGAKIVSVKAVRGGNEVELDVLDPVGSFLTMEPSAFRLVQEFADPAFKLRAKALLPGGDDGGARLLVFQQGRVSRHPVQILEKAAGDTVVRDPTGALKTSSQVVVGRVDGQPLTTLVDDTAVQVEAR